MSFVISLFINLNDLYESLSKEFEPLFKAEEIKPSLSSSEASKKQDGYVINFSHKVIRFTFTHI